MEMTRRGFLGGMAGILAAGVAPAFVGSKILMPIKPSIIKPPSGVFVHNGHGWMRITAVDFAGQHHEIEPVTLYRGDSRTIEIPGCTGQIIAYNISMSFTA